MKSNGIGLFTSGETVEHGLWSCCVFHLSQVRSRLGFRHQILIKATSLGLKESSSRGIKRSRETDAEQVETSSTTVPTTAASAANARPTSSSSVQVASPNTSHPTSTPTASPIIRHQSRPPAASSTPVPTSAHLPWPMPTVAANTPSPVVVNNSQGESRNTGYYRPTAHQDERETASKQPSIGRTVGTTTHQFMYQPNGNGGSRSKTKENGK